MKTAKKISFLLSLVLLLISSTLITTFKQKAGKFLATILTQQAPSASNITSEAPDTNTQQVIQCIERPVEKQKEQIVHCIERPTQITPQPQQCIERPKVQITPPIPIIKTVTIYQQCLEKQPQIIPPPLIKNITQTIQCIDKPNTVIDQIPVTITPPVQNIILPYCDEIVIPQPQPVPQPLPPVTITPPAQNITLPYCDEIVIPQPQPIPQPLPHVTITPPAQNITLPYCDEIVIPQPTVINPPPVQNTTLPYCDEIVVPQPPYTVIPPVEIPVVTPVIPPKVFSCNEWETGCCWWGNYILPKSFWVKEDFTSGKDYIVIGNSGNYLSTDIDGNLSLVQSVSKNSLWRVFKISDKIINLISYYGGYLSIHEDGTVDAKSRIACDDSQIHALISNNNCSPDGPNYAAFRAINGFYLNFAGGIASSSNILTDQSQIFKGYLYDESGSQCLGNNSVPSTISPNSVAVETVSQTVDEKTGKIIEITCKVSGTEDKSKLIVLNKAIRESLRNKLKSRNY